jgi:hypothetical protein
MDTEQQATPPNLREVDACTGCRFVEYLDDDWGNPHPVCEKYGVGVGYWDVCDDFEPQPESQEATARWREADRNETSPF